jgi:hypothetical protein
VRGSRILLPVFVLLFAAVSAHADDAPAIGIQPIAHTSSTSQTTVSIPVLRKPYSHKFAHRPALR